MAFVAVIIIAMAVYIFANYSSMTFTRGIILIGIGIAGIIIIAAVMLILYLGIQKKKGG